MDPKAGARERFDAARASLVALSHRIHAHPELGTLVGMRRMRRFVVAFAAAAAVGCGPDESKPHGAAGGGGGVPGRDPFEIAALSGSVDGYCVLSTDGEVACWSKEWPTTSPDAPMPIARVPELHDLVDVAPAVGRGFDAWGLDRTGNVLHWTGAFQDGTHLDWSPDPDFDTQVWPPETLDGFAGAVAITAGSDDFPCAVLADGGVRCWNPPTDVTGIPTRVVDVAGYGYVYLLLEDGTVGIAENLLDPALGPLYEGYGFENGTQITAGDLFQCVVEADATAACGGENGYGGLGNGSVGGSYPPGPVIGLQDVVTIAAGTFHACALRRDGSVWCWGEWGDGYLGAGPRPPHGGLGRPYPAPVLGLPPAKFVGPTCAVTLDDEVYCWGQLGPIPDGGSASDRLVSDVPVLMTWER